MIALEAPLDNLIGFERAPLFAADAAAQGTLGKAEKRAPALETRAKPASRNEHADLDGSCELTCAKPDEAWGLCANNLSIWPLDWDAMLVLRFTKTLT